MPRLTCASVKSGCIASIFRYKSAARAYCWCCCAADASAQICSMDEADGGDCPKPGAKSNKEAVKDAAHRRPWRRFENRFAGEFNPFVFMCSFTFGQAAEKAGTACAVPVAFFQWRPGGTSSIVCSARHRLKGRSRSIQAVLEQDFDRTLNLAWLECAGDLAEVGVSQAGIGIGEVGVVEDVKRVASNLDPPPLVQL